MRAIAHGLIALLAFVQTLNSTEPRPRQAPFADPATEIPAGFVRLQGEHITLVTDLPSSPPLQQLVAAFDQSVAQWASYFDVDRELTASWHMTGYVVGEESHFRQLQHWPTERPDFPHGYQSGWEFWIREQPSDYYRQHLWLHEGTHAFMNHFLHGTGPPWLAEGLAELLATHTQRDQRVVLNAFPQQKQEYPYWGRIKLVRDAVAAHRALTVEQVIALRATDFADVEAYAWSWALATLLDKHPGYSTNFRRALRRFHGNEWLDQAAWWDQLPRQSSETPTLELTWQAFLDQLDFGYPLAEEAITMRPSQEPKEKATLSIDSRKGWQSTGWLVRAEHRYQLKATGRYRLRGGPPRWSSEAGGVTIEYVHGAPLGILLGGLAAERRENSSESGLHQPFVIGTDLVWQPAEDGILYLRINEPTVARADNEGRLEVTLEERFDDASPRTP